MPADSGMTFAEAPGVYIEQLGASGKSPATYGPAGGDLRIAGRLLGTGTPLRDLTGAWLGTLLKSSPLTERRDGKVPDWQALGAMLGRVRPGQARLCLAGECQCGCHCCRPCARGLEREAVDEPRSCARPRAFAACLETNARAGFAA